MLNMDSMDSTICLMNAPYAKLFLHHKNKDWNNKRRQNTLSSTNIHHSNRAHKYLDQYFTLRSIFIMHPFIHMIFLQKIICLYMGLVVVVVVVPRMTTR